MDDKELARRTWGSSPTGWSARASTSLGLAPSSRRSCTIGEATKCLGFPRWCRFTRPVASASWRIGFGPGYDALTFLEAGAHYSGIDITPENVDRAKKHLGFFGYSPDVREGDAEALPYDDASFDFVFFQRRPASWSGHPPRPLRSGPRPAPRQDHLLGATCRIARTVPPPNA